MLTGGSWAWLSPLSCAAFSLGAPVAPQIEEEVEELQEVAAGYASSQVSGVPGLVGASVEL